MPKCVVLGPGNHWNLTSILLDSLLDTRKEMLDTRKRIETTTRLGSILETFNTRLLDTRKNDVRSTSNGDTLTVNALMWQIMLFQPKPNNIKTLLRASRVFNSYKEPRPYKLKNSLGRLGETA